MSLPIPPNMLDLQRYGDVAVGYYFEWVDAYGKVACQSPNPPVKPDFRVVCPKRWAECVVKDLCCLCGKPLDYWKWIVSDEPTTEGRAFPDPAMHYVCARYAISVCPFLLGVRDHRRERMPEGAERQKDRFKFKAQPETRIRNKFYLCKIRDQWPALQGKGFSFCRKNRVEICTAVEAGKTPMVVCTSRAVDFEEYDREGANDPTSS